MIRYPPASIFTAAALFSAIGVWTLAPVLADLHGSIPGAGLGDNAAGFWNAWWFTRAVEAGNSPYWTDRLFAPFGTQLSLHTHATTHSVLAWAMSPFTSLVAAHNLAILVGLALNGICAWLLAYRLTQRLVPSLVAGVLFACSAQVQLRVVGHINLVHAWVLPLFALACLRLERTNSLRAALLAGAAGALVIYTDYYYAVYALLFVAISLAARRVTVHVATGSPRLARVRGLLLALILVDLVLIAAIAWSGGAAWELGGLRISARGIRNPLTVLWLLTSTLALLQFAPSVVVRRRGEPNRDARRVGLASAAFMIVLTSPLLFALVQVLAAGEYTAPRVLWRSSPAGADALTLVLGHPLHLLTGRWTTSAYSALDIDLMEQSLWIGVLPLVLIGVTWPRLREAPAARLWLTVALVFFVLSLGPFLRVAGVDTALPLPHVVLRYLPGIGNARMPGRAVTMVSLSVAVLTALSLSVRSSRANGLSLAIAVVLILEALPAAPRVQHLPMKDAIDELLLSSRQPGAVAELPTGLRDGFGDVGALDHRALMHQVWHGRPLVGGFVARLSSDIQSQYEEIPILKNLVDLSDPATADVHLIPHAAEDARQVGIAYLIVNRDTFIDTRLPHGLLDRAGFRLLAKEGAREVYATGQPAR